MANNIIQGNGVMLPFNRETGYFQSAMYNATRFDSMSSSTANSGIPDQVRGTIKKIEMSYTWLSGDIQSMLLRSAQDEMTMSGATPTKISGNNYKVTYSGTPIDFLNAKIRNNSNKDVYLDFRPSPYGSSYTFSNPFISIEYDFAYSIHHKVLLGDPNAGNVKLKIMYEGLDDDEDRSWHDLNQVRYESTLSFSGHPQIVKNGTGRIIEYSPSEIKASQGTLNIKLYRVAHNSDLNQSIDSLIGTINKSVAFTATPPVISALEPENIDVNITQAYPITWVVDRQDSFKLTVNGQVFSGTTARQVLVPANTFKKGLNTITLQSTLGIATATKTVTFRGYGRPNNPVIAEREIYNTSLPTITWATDEQNIYHIQIKQGSTTVIDSGEVISSEQRYKVTTPLQNETNYTVRLRVKNAQGLYSDWMEKTILISYQQLEPPELDLYATSGDLVTVNVTNTPDVDYGYSEVFKKSEYGDWKKIAINGPRVVTFQDFHLASAETYYYKVVAYDRNGGAVESEIKSISIKLKSATFLDLGTMTEIAGSYMANDAGLAIQTIQDKQVIKYEGLRAPVTEQGETDYSILNFDGMFRNYSGYKKFRVEAEKAPVVLFRTPQGHYYYCQVTGWGESRVYPTGLVQQPFVFTEVDYREGVIYDGNYTLKIIRLDQGRALDKNYKLDGNYD